jgi:uncharacterized protein (DUF433 family)
MCSLSHVDKGVHFEQGGYMENKSAHSDPDIMGGVPVFIGTRVPISYMFDYLKAGETIEVFLNHYPTVSRNAAIDTLKIAAQLVGKNAHFA